MQFKPRNIFLLLLAIFLFFVAYKYMATGIQENKEKAVIQERAKTQQQAVDPKDVSQETRSPIKAVLPEQDALDRAGYCGAGLEIDAAKKWIHACYLKDLLSKECKQLFDINGYYLTGDYDSALFPNGYVDTYTYLQNAKICGCRLPADIASQLNSDSERAQTQCKQLDIFKKQ